MEINLIIQKSEFTTDKLIPQATDDAKVERCIREAQQFDLRPLIGDALYYDLVRNYDPDLSGGPDETYEKLVDGESYENDLEELIEFSGLRMAIKYWAYARLIASQNVNVTTHGVVIKTNDFSTPVSNATISAEVSSARQGAVRYWEEAKAYLNTKIDDFPLWKKCSRPEARGGISMFSVGGD